MTIDQSAMDRYLLTVPQYEPLNIDLPDYKYIGIDGEGQGRDPHKYVFLAAAGVDGKRWSVSNPNGLTTVECLEFLLELPTYYPHKFFMYSFNYDLTKMLQGLGNEQLFKLFRPELRPQFAHNSKLTRAKRGPRPVHWNGYTLNLQGTKFTIEHEHRKIVIWDIWKFFQGRFTDALVKWKVGDPALLKRMADMKDQRADFDKLNREQVQEYCFEECECMAELAKRLTESHAKAGLKLKSYYGAGSSATAMLEKMDIKKYMTDPPTAMVLAVACAFFGGRFENAWIGHAKGPVYGWDIASAYPYQLYHLPCLMHARWRFTSKRKDIDKAPAALVRYTLKAISGNTDQPWGPFPYRTRTGTTCYPQSSGGGWVWKDEYLAGEKGFENVGFREAWVMEKGCDCHPFKDIAEYYIERCRIGKTGPGIVIKLGTNSCYGKLAQSIGQAVFSNWIWAGMVTSGCRAQLLEMLIAHKDRSNVLMMATDGLYTKEKITPPKPNPTGTESTGIPLGMWESEKEHEEVFCARPGIYFPMNPTEEQLASIKARGIGRKAVLKYWKEIEFSYRLHGIKKTVTLPNISRFCGAKTSISRTGKNGHYIYRRAERRSPSQPAYGQWIERPVKMSFDPMPKRAGVIKGTNRLQIRAMHPDIPSFPYLKALKNFPTLRDEINTLFKKQADHLGVKPDKPDPAIAQMQKLAATLEEQPDLDLTEYDLGDDV